MMMDTTNNSSSCEGTHEIYIGSGDSDLVDKKGIVAVWKRHPEVENPLDDDISYSESTWGIQILATDQEAVYRYLVDTKSNANSDSQTKTELDLDALIACILNRDANQKAVYKYLLDPDDDTLPVKSIQITIESLQYTCVLKSIVSSDESINASLDSNDPTASMIMMINSLHTFYKDTKKLQGQMTKWKYTATQLDDKWQNVQSQLLENFLTLHKKVKDELQSCRLELEEEKRKQQDHSSTVKPTVFDGKALDYDDDEDFVPYDSDEVERLARGPIHVSKKETKTQPRVSDEPMTKSNDEVVFTEMKKSSLMEKPSPPMVVSIKKTQEESIEMQSLLKMEKPCPPMVVSIKKMQEESIEKQSLLKMEKPCPPTTQEESLEKQSLLEKKNVDINRKRPNSFESQDRATESQPKKARVFIDLADDESDGSSDSEMVLL